MNVLTELEIRDIIRNKVNNVSGPIRIIFSDSVCLDCGEEGDVRQMFYNVFFILLLNVSRLMGEWCHMESCRIHLEDARPQHPGGQTQHHPTDRLCHIHPGHVSVGRCGRLCGCGPCVTPRYSCCGRKENTEGCRQVLVCCRNTAHAVGCEARWVSCSQELHYCDCCHQVQMLWSQRGHQHARMHQHLPML